MIFRDFKRCCLSPTKNYAFTTLPVTPLITPYHIISYHIISYHIISYHITSCHIISYYYISLLLIILDSHDTSIKKQSKWMVYNVIIEIPSIIPYNPISSLSFSRLRSHIIPCHLYHSLH